MPAQTVFRLTIVRVLAYAILGLATQGCGLGAVSGADPLAAPAKADDTPIPRVIATKIDPSRCGRVGTIKRAWVGFDDSLTLDDAETLARAVPVIIKTLDSAMCAVGSGRVEDRVLQPERAALLQIIASGGRFIVTSFDMSRAGETLSAVIKLNASNAPLTWTARASSDAQGWNLLKLERVAVR